VSGRVWFRRERSCVSPAWGGAAVVENSFTCGESTSIEIVVTERREEGLKAGRKSRRFHATGQTINNGLPRLPRHPQTAMATYTAHRRPEPGPSTRAPPPTVEDHFRPSYPHRLNLCAPFATCKSRPFSHKHSAATISHLFLMSPSNSSRPGRWRVSASLQR